MYEKIKLILNVYLLSFKEVDTEQISQENIICWATTQRKKKTLNFVKLERGRYVYSV
jgi:hypothetical protein